jgi:hypothetical protein
MTGARRRDLTGQTFDQLTVIGFAGHKGTRALWNCRCTCGGTRVLSTIDLRASRVRSCGCANRIDMTGRKCGKLTVIGPAKDRRFWRCRCECGETTVVAGTKLRNGYTRSCGCLRGVPQALGAGTSLVGRKFGRLTAEKFEGNRRWACRCECGKRIVTNGPALTRGMTQSCGCLRQELLEARRETEARARVGQTDGHLFCEAYLGRRDFYGAVRHYFRFKCLPCGTKVERPWDSPSHAAKSCGCTTPNGGIQAYAKKARETKNAKLIGKVFCNRRVDAYVGKKGDRHYYRLTCLDCQKEALLAGNPKGWGVCYCRIRRTPEQEAMRVLIARMRSRFHMALKRKGIAKSDNRTFRHFDYTTQQLLAHIEARFLPGMSWANRHLWHIDHIKPLAKAKTHAEIVKLFALKNLQPMWAPDNQRKQTMSMAEWRKQLRAEGQQATP